MHVSLDKASVSDYTDLDREETILPAKGLSAAEPTWA